MMVKFAPQCLPPAVFSECRRYRFGLNRRAGWGDSICAFIMLNPSTADEEKSDPTISRCIGFAARWGYGWLHVLNLFPWRTTDPHELTWVDVDPIGPMAWEGAISTFNDAMIRAVIDNADLVVAAWGNWGGLRNRSSEVRDILRQYKTPVKCFGLTKAGEPQHPCMCPGTESWRTCRETQTRHPAPQSLVCG